MTDLHFMTTAMTVSAILIGLWQLTLSPEERFDSNWEAIGSAAGLGLFVVAAVAVKFLHAR